MKIIERLTGLIQGRYFDDINDIKVLQGKILLKQSQRNKSKNIQNYEFKIFSQFGDDGIIQFLIDKISINPKDRIFVEFGVENYTESNTRFLLINNNWKGLVMDASKGNIDFIKKDEIYWKYDLTAVECFVTKDNINEVLGKSGLRGSMGLLCIDIDGNDYWIWKAITLIEPIIVIVEYNSVFGTKRAVSVPYVKNFYRTKAHFSNLYWGASLGAYCELANQKGYVFVGTNSAGNNAYFVKKEYSKSLKIITLREGYTESKYRESRNKKGNLTFVSGRERIKVISNMPIYDIDKRKIIKIGEILE